MFRTLIVHNSRTVGRIPLKFSVEVDGSKWELRCDFEGPARRQLSRRRDDAVFKGTRP